MKLDRLSLHPKQYYTLEEPLRIFISKDKESKISQTEFEIIGESLTKRKTPLVITGKEKNSKEGKYWTYYLQMPTYSLQVSEGVEQKTNLSAVRFLSEDGKNRSYHNRHQQLFFLEATKGIYLVYRGKSYFVSPEGTWSLCDEANLDWEMTPEVYDELLDRMRSYFQGEDEYVRSQRVSANMRYNVMDPFDQYTRKEHDFETQKVDFTKGVKYTGAVVAGRARGKKSSYALFSNDISADPEKSTLAVGQRVAIYREDESFTNLTGLLVEIDTAADEGVRFVLEFYQQFNREQLPQKGYLFVHQNDTQLKIRQNVSKSIYRGKTPAKYIYKTFHDFSVSGYENLQMHPDLAEFLYERMGRQFPPNQMQLEAIVKGILTEDLLLVLGPPGTGKTTVIETWVEYYLSRGQRVLISSQNNAAVDNVLERLGKNENREIVRLGRDEKVQENCRKFIPENRVKAMREACKSNSEQLETKLLRDWEQLDAYMEALTALRDLRRELADVTKKMKPGMEQMKTACGLLQTSSEELERVRSQIEFCQLRIKRYGIFLEESRKKGLWARLMEFGLRSRAKYHSRELAKTVKEQTPVLAEKQKAYAGACRNLEQQLQLLRTEGLLDRHSRIQTQISQTEQRILGEADGRDGLVPVFRSALKDAAPLGQFVQPRREDLKKLTFLERQIAVMEQAKVSAEKILNASRQWVQAALKGDRNEVFEEIMLAGCQVVGATCIGINSNKLFRDVQFDVTVIDESGQIQLQNALVPISRSPKTLMLGDYKQIPPIVNEDIAASCRMEDISTELYEQSFFEYLFEKLRGREIQWLSENPKHWVDVETLPAEPEAAKQRCVELAKAEILKPRVPDYIGVPIPKKIIGPDGVEMTRYHSRYSRDEVKSLIEQIIRDRKKIVNLNSQFRMPGHISDVISEWFYESNYFSSYDMSRFAPVVPGTDLPMVVIDTSRMKNRFETQPDNKMGYQNPAEAELVADVLQRVLERKSEKEQQAYLKSLDSHLGVISAYGAQVRYIRQTLRKRLGLSNSEANTAVASLDSFQGQERDLIIYSLTRSGKKHSEQARVGFLKELRRLNVAFTRCKKQLVIIGDLNYLQSCLYVEKDLDRAGLPCAGTSDGTITQVHINQCSECQADCERRFSRFFRLLMQHVRADPAAGNLIPGDKFKESLKGGKNHAE